MFDESDILGMSEDELIGLLAEDAMSAGCMPDDPQVKRMLAFAFSEQREFISDESRKKCALCPRRAGKSYAVGIWLCLGWMFRPGQRSMFIARTIAHARDILWDVLKDLDRRWEWGASFNESRSEMTFPNGYRIRLRGVSTMREAEKIRGGHYWKVAVDEAHLYEEALLQFLLKSVIEPALIDLRGMLTLTGTPGYVLAGLWFEATAPRDEFPDAKGEPWPTHRWSMLDNPHLPDAQGELDRLMREHGWDEDHPEVVREWKGRWVKDDGALVYIYDPVRHSYLDGDGTFDERQWVKGSQGMRTVIGVDTGWSDGNGFVVAQKRFDSPRIRIPVGFRCGEMTDHEIARTIKKLMHEYGTRHVFMDSSTILQESMHNYGVPAKKAIKGEKRPRIEYVRSLQATENICIHAQDASDLAGEWQTLPWGYKLSKALEGTVRQGGTRDDESRDAQLGERIGHKEGFIDETADAALYAVMPLTQKFQAILDEAERPKPGSPEWLDEQDRLARQRAANRPQESGKRRPRKPKRRR